VLLLPPLFATFTETFLTMLFSLRFLLIAAHCFVFGQCDTSFADKIITEIAGQCNQYLKYDAATIEIQSHRGEFQYADQDQVLTWIRQIYNKQGLTNDFLPSADFLLSANAPRVAEHALQLLRHAGMTGFAQCVVGIEMATLVWHALTLIHGLGEMNTLKMNVKSLRRSVERIIAEYFANDKTMQKLYDPETRKRCARDLKDASEAAADVREHHTRAWWLSVSSAVVGSVCAASSFSLAAVPAFASVKSALIVGGALHSAMSLVDCYNLVQLWDAFKELDHYDAFLAEGKTIVKRLNRGGKLTKTDHKFAKKVRDDAELWLRKREAEEESS